MILKLTHKQYISLFNLKYDYYNQDDLGYRFVPMAEFLKEQYNCDYSGLLQSNLIISGSEEDITFLLLKL